MTTKINYFFYMLTALILVNCTSKNYKLTAEEQKLCDSIQFDASILQSIRAVNSSKIESFHYSLGKMYKDGAMSEIDPIHLNGIVFEEKNSKSYDLIFELKDSFKEKGYSIFMVENNFNIDNQPDRIAVLKTTNKFDILKQIKTDGINYDITNDSLIKIIKKFDAKYSLELMGASGDWCEFIVTKKPENWNTFAQEVYEVCPDVVDQGSGSVEALAEEMKTANRLFFWWD